MAEYRPSALREYIEKSELRIVSSDFCVRLSPELAKKYDTGEYDFYRDSCLDYISQIKSLGLKYPGNAKPVFYWYIVPTEDSYNLLTLPFKSENGGGRPVGCFSLDGFNSAYGTSENMAKMQKRTVAGKVNDIHEFAHLIHGQFFNKDRIFSEGFAEVLPWYLLNYEGKDTEHIDIIKQISVNEIYSAKELLNDLAAMNDFVEGKGCMFQKTYLSSYLFIRGIISKIEKKFSIDKITATQKFLEFMRSSQMSKEFMVFELADFIGMDREELLNGKSLQLSVQTEIAKSLKNKKLAKAKDNLITVGKFARIGKLSSRNKNLEK